MGRVGERGAWEDSRGTGRGAGGGLGSRVEGLSLGIRM